MTFSVLRRDAAAILWRFSPCILNIVLYQLIFLWFIVFSVSIDQLDQRFAVNSNTNSTISIISQKWKSCRSCSTYTKRPRRCLLHQFPGAIPYSDDEREVELRTPGPTMQRGACQIRFEKRIHKTFIWGSNMFPSSSNKTSGTYQFYNRYYNVLLLRTGFNVESSDCNPTFATWLQCWGLG